MSAVTAFTTGNYSRQPCVASAFVVCLDVKHFPQDIIQLITL